MEATLADAQASHARALHTAEADAAAAVGSVEVQLADAKAQLVAEGLRHKEALAVGGGGGGDVHCGCI